MLKPNIRVALTFAAVFVAVTATPGASVAQTAATEQVLTGFGALDANCANATGANILSPLVDGLDGSFYGVTVNGGANGMGTVFKIGADGSYVVLYSFGSKASNSDGALPNALTRGSDGNFYGTTYAGGVAGGQELPRSSGTTYCYGLHGLGTVFRITPAGQLSTLHAFGAFTSGGNNIGVNADGAYPMSRLALGKDGNLYGTAYTGGANSTGTVFQVDAATGNVTPIYAFPSRVGNTSQGVIQGADGKLYGVQSGEFYSLTLQGEYTTIHVFSIIGGEEGALPNDIVQGTDGNFYGTAQRGGANGYGAVFKIDASGSYTSLHDFTPPGAAGNQDSKNADGISPFAPLVEAADGAFYGTTSEAGPNAFGTVFKVTTSGTFSVIYAFGNQVPDGALSYSPLIEASDGKLWGATARGEQEQPGTSNSPDLFSGPYVNGTIFHITLPASSAAGGGTTGGQTSEHSGGGGKQNLEELAWLATLVVANSIYRRRLRWQKL